MTGPRTPQGLSARSGRLWRSTIAVYELAAAELELLRGALEALDRADSAAEQLKSEGLTVEGRYGMRPHPCVEIETKNRALFGRFVAQLGIKLDDATATVGSGPRSNVKQIRGAA